MRRSVETPILHRWFFSVAVCVALISRADAQGNAKPSTDSDAIRGRYYALVIGINDYPAPIPKLTTALNDARAVAQLLQSKYGFEVRQLLDGDATRGHILETLSGYETSLKDNDSLLIYYAGHGFENKASNQTYWLPADANSARSSNRISANDLTSEFAVLQARHVLVISDSCYSGGLTRDVDDKAAPNTGEVFLRKMLDGRSRNLMASGRDEPVADDGPDNHSVFAAAVLKALQEEARPMFSASDLFYNSVQRRVAGNALQIPQYATIRNSGDEFGDFVFRLADASAVAVSKSLASPSSAYDEADSLYMSKKFFEAARMVAPLCDANDPRACSLLGLMFEKGEGVAADQARAVDLYRKSCQQGSPRGCGNLGAAYEGGRGVPKDEKQSFVLSVKACDQGWPWGCFRVGRSYEQGIGTEINHAQAAVFFRKACEAGEDRACTALGINMEQDSRASTNLSQAAGVYRKACSSGGFQSCSKLAYALETGYGIQQNVEQAAEFYRKACDGDFAYACWYLGNLYAAGKGVPQDKHQAVAFFDKSCRPDAHNDGGLCMDAGNSLRTVDPARSVAAFGMGCEAGNQRACLWAGDAYARGRGVPQDRTTAIAYLHRSCPIPVSTENSCEWLALRGHVDIAMGAVQETLEASERGDGRYTPEEAVKRAAVLDAQARLFDFLNNSTEAAKAEREAIRLAPEPTQYLVLSRALRYGKNLEAAFQVVSEGRAKFPNDGNLKLERSYLLAASGRAEEAVTFCSAMIRGDQEGAAVFAYLTNAYLALHQKDKADAQLRLAESISTTPSLLPLTVSAFNHVGYELVVEGDRLDDAVVLLREAVKLSPESGDELDSLGFAYLKQGHYSEAEPILAKAAALSPDEGTIWDHLGDTYAKQGEKVQALQAWRRALEDHNAEGGDDPVKTKIVAATNGARAATQ